ncbi:GntR family transcriptional regulator [Cohnella fermenti]|uniref:GntR family transcriptional regulator n=1 Tax=Cohnella fermenti TaxID=2565925 RepID=A0A4S4BWN1_9BACL|nr:GntR family transcriptional regulator [Cohnella fermenti]THF79605.1 GntR family transcriptional regulator [Cohnella fermenti]
MLYPSSWLRGASLGEAISCELRLGIVTGKLKPGEKLSENGIAADFGTSRSPVREALRTLSGEGLIRLERMGAVVVGLGAEEVRELYDVRCLIESFAQERLSRMDREPILARLERILDRMELAAKHKDIEEFALLDFTFHETIVEEANHSRIRQLWRSIRQLVLTVMLVTTEDVFGEGEARVAAVIGKHRALLDSLRSGDETEVREQVRTYFADSFATLDHTLGRA